MAKPTFSLPIIMDARTTKKILDDEVNRYGGLIYDGSIAAASDPALAQQVADDVAASASAAQQSAIDAALYDGPRFDTVTEFFASTDTFTAGTYVRTDAEGFAYRAVDTGGHVQNADGQEFEVDRAASVYQTSATIAFSGASAVADLTELSLKQASGSNLSHVVTGSFSTVSEPNINDFKLFVDGNRDNNTAAITGYKVTLLKRVMNRQVIGAINCDTGVHIQGNVEYAKFDIHVDYCGTGVLVNNDTTITPDELILNVLGHQCTTFFLTNGTNKATGHITFGCEQSDSYGAVFEQGYWEIHGILRGIGTVSDGGLKIAEDANVTGNIRLQGGSDTNCEWLADIQGGTLWGLSMIFGAKFKNGARIMGGTSGSACIQMQQAPAATGTQVAVKMGDASGTTLFGFHILPGSSIQSGAVAIDLNNAKFCLVEADELVGDIVIGSASLDNTICVPRRTSNLVTFTNNRTEVDNKIIFKGAYTLAEMNALNGGTLFRGMEVEQALIFSGQRAYYNGDQWVPSHGRLVGGTITVASGSVNGSASHGLADPRTNTDLVIYPSSSLGSDEIDRFVVSTTDVVVFLKAAATDTREFTWSLRANS